MRAILAAVAIPLQLGGGIRDMRTVESWLAAGVERVILGTAALGNPALVREAAKAFPGRIAVALDARHGKVATDGWVKTSETDAAALALAFEDAGLAAIVYTDIERDGALVGPNVEATAALARRLTTPGDRLGRCGLARGPRGTQGARGRRHRRCHRRQGTL